MYELFIKGTAHTPEINFKPHENFFSISGRSIPEDSDIYYYPVIRYLESYLESIKESELDSPIIFEFRLIYYNTTSIRYLNSVMGLIEGISKIKIVQVKWHYDSDDEYLKEMGYYFKKGYDIDIEIIRHQAPKKTKRRYN